MVFNKKFMGCLVFVFIVAGINHTVLAEEVPNEGKAITTSDPAIALEELQIILNPMTQEALFVEADGWLALLQKAAQRIAQVKLEIFKVNHKIEKQEEKQEVKEKIAEIKQVDNLSERKELKKALEEEVKTDLEEDLAEPKKEVTTYVTNELAGELRQALAEVQQQGEGAEKTKQTAGAKNGVKNDVNKGEETKLDKATERKKDILKVLSNLRNDRSAIVERLDLVLIEINRKIGLDEQGGELAEVLPYRRYIDTVGSIKLDLSDSTSTLLSIKAYVFSDDGGKEWLINTAVFLVILFVFMVLSRILSNAVKKALSFTKNGSKILNDFFINSVRRLTFIVGVLVAMSAVGISVAPIMAVIGAAGFVVAFALQGTLSNFASGIMIMLYRPFDVGDLVEVAGIMGQVKSMTLVSTTIMTFDNKLMIVPNNSIWGDVITNAHYSKERRVDMMFGIGYDDNIEQAMQVMNKILSDHPSVLASPKSTVQVHELGDSSVNFVCRPWVKTADYWDVYWDITRAVKEGFDAAGISIPFPQTDVHLHHSPEEPKEQHSATIRQLNKNTTSDQFNEMDVGQED